LKRYFRRSSGGSSSCTELLIPTKARNCGESPPLVTSVRRNLLNLRNAACGLPHCTQRSEPPSPGSEQECPRGEGLMMKLLPTVVLLATICVSAALALAHTMHSKAIRSARNEIVRPASQRIGPSGPSEHLRTGSPFELCLHQDPTTPALRIGPCECLPLPY
jgi:hypothetical protein